MGRQTRRGFLGLVGGVIGAAVAGVPSLVGSRKGEAVMPLEGAVVKGRTVTTRTLTGERMGRRWAQDSVRAFTARRA